MENNRFELTILRDDPQLLTAIWSNAVLWIWRAKTDDELLDLLEEDVFTVRERMTSNYGILTILIGEERERPEEGARKRLSAVIKQSTSHLIARATVIESEGFRATVSRSAITDIEVAARRRDVPHQTFSNLREATGWLARSLGHEQSWARELHKIATEHRKRLTGDSA